MLGQAVYLARQKTILNRAKVLTSKPVSIVHLFLENFPFFVGEGVIIKIASAVKKWT